MIELTKEEAKAQGMEPLSRGMSRKALTEIVADMESDPNTKWARVRLSRLEYQIWRVPKPPIENADQRSKKKPRKLTGYHEFAPPLSLQHEFGDPHRTYMSKIG